MSVVLPDTIGPYRLLRPIARGGMAEVYEVEDPSSGEHLALKLLLETGGALPRFNREYEAMIRLNHPNIVRVYHYGHHGESPWLTMELIEGTPIQAYAKATGRAGTPKRCDEVVRTSHDLALALDHIHRRGLVHRDLKSANVLVLPDGRVKLIDFGTAMVADAVEDITRDGEFIGTFAYASPEQLTQGHVDHRSDLYSLGVLLYRLATAKRPFNATDLHALARQHVKEQPKPPSELIRRGSLPDGLEEVILALLEKRASNRPQSGQEVAEALERVAGHPLLLPNQLDVVLSTDSLVGRESQMSALWRTLDAAESGETEPAHTALITGLVGSGRQHAIAALEKDVRSREWRVFSWFCHKGKDPLESLQDTLREVVGTFEGADPAIVPAVAALEQLSGPGQAATERIDGLVEAGRVLFGERARRDAKPVLLLVRAVQNAGPVGFEALVRLRQGLIAAKARIVLFGDLLETHDDEESLARNRLPDAYRIHLPPLQVHQVALLVGSLLHRRPPPGAIARRIHRATGGLPVYVEEVVRGMVKNGLLRIQGRDVNRIEWAAQDEIDIPVAQSAKNRVMDSLAELPADRRRVLEALALLDGEGSAGVLAGALEGKASELRPALADLDRRGWISLEDTKGVPYARWRQMLASSVVLEQMHPCRRRVLERRLIEQVAHEPAFAGQIRLLLEVGRHAEALDRALDWGVHHLAKNRPVTALEALDLVAPYVDDAPVDTSTKARIYLLHVTALLMARPTDVNTSRSLAKATRLGREEGDHFEAELHLLRARIQRVIGHYPNFRKHLMEAWYLIEHAPPTSLGATVSGLLGWSNRAAGAVDAAATWHGRARRIAVQIGVAAVRAHADVGVSGWQFSRGLMVESERTAAGALSVFLDVGDKRGLALALPVWTNSLCWQARFSEALEVLDQEAPAMRQAEAPSLYVRLLLATAWAEVELCRLGRAQECVDELAATLRKGEHLDLRLSADLVWGKILLASGQLKDAHHRLHFVRDRAQNAGLQIIAEWANALMSEVLWVMGDQAHALEGFQRSVSALIRAGDIPTATAACRAQSRAMGHVLGPDRIFEPVAGFIDREPAIVARIERALARARYCRQQGRDPMPDYNEARMLLADVNNQLNPTDQAALYLHPWTRELRSAGVI